MVAYYNINDLELGPASHSSGHEAYLEAKHILGNKRIIYKKNKHGLPIFSRFEVIFSLLAQLFLSPNLTSTQQLVVDDNNNILGLAVDHLFYAIHAKEGLNDTFYSLKNPQKNCDLKSEKITDPSKIPIHFLDKLPQGFFAQLMKEQKVGKLTFDYDSLASILCTCYTMEEDDLHKGNYGFYIVEKNSKPHVVFFKIDHDLMFVDSIMSFQTRRPYHLFHGPDAFRITAEDIISFPKLKHSANSYWPTKFSYISNPFDNKEYHNFAENGAFADLGREPEFIKAKWKAFYRHILISSTLMQNNLIESVNSNNPIDRAYVALTTHAMHTRLANLRSVLFSIQEFRDFVVNLNAAKKQELLDEIIPQGNPLQEDIRQSLGKFETLCNLDKARGGFVEGDTPLHTAIKLGEYRYDETCRMFGHFINVKNKAGETPLDVALKQWQANNALSPDIRKDTRSIMQHLLEKGANKTPQFKIADIEDALNTYKFKNPYLESVKSTTSYAELKKTLRDLGEDYTFCLKYKKNIATDCIKRWVNARKNAPLFYKELIQLKKEVNGKSSEEDCAGIKYIRQLRSKLWIIRQLRGLYGQTTTQTEINNIIDKSLDALKAKASDCSCSFFSSKNLNLQNGIVQEEEWIPIY